MGIEELKQFADKLLINNVVMQSQASAVQGKLDFMTKEYDELCHACQQDQKAVEHHIQEILALIQQDHQQDAKFVGVAALANAVLCAKAEYSVKLTAMLKCVESTEEIAVRQLQDIEKQLEIDQLWEKAVELDNSYYKAAFNRLEQDTQQKRDAALQSLMETGRGNAAVLHQGMTKYEAAVLEKEQTLNLAVQALELFREQSRALEIQVAEEESLHAVDVLLQERRIQDAAALKRNAEERAALHALQVDLADVQQQYANSEDHNQCLQEQCIKNDQKQKKLSASLQKMVERKAEQQTQYKAKDIALAQLKSQQPVHAAQLASFQSRIATLEGITAQGHLERRLMAVMKEAESRQQVMQSEDQWRKWIQDLSHKFIVRRASIKKTEASVRRELEFEQMQVFRQLMMQHMDEDQQLRISLQARHQVLNTEQQSRQTIDDLEQQQFALLLDAAARDQNQIHLDHQRRVEKELHVQKVRQQVDKQLQQLQTSEKGLRDTLMDEFNESQGQLKAQAESEMMQLQRENAQSLSHARQQLEKSQRAISRKTTVQETVARSKLENEQIQEWKQLCTALTAAKQQLTKIMKGISKLVTEETIQRTSLDQEEFKHWGILEEKMNGEVKELRLKVSKASDHSKSSQSPNRACEHAAKSSQALKAKRQRVSSVSKDSEKPMTAVVKDEPLSGDEETFYFTAPDSPPQKTAPPSVSTPANRVHWLLSSTSARKSHRTPSTRPSSPPAFPAPDLSKKILQAKASESDNEFDMFHSPSAATPKPTAMTDVLRTPSVPTVPQSPSAPRKLFSSKRKLSSLLSSSSNGSSTPAKHARFDYDAFFMED